MLKKIIEFFFPINLIGCSNDSDDPVDPVDPNSITFENLKWTFQVTGNNGQDNWFANNEQQGYNKENAMLITNSQGNKELKVTIRKVIENGVTYYKSSRLEMQEKVPDLKLERGTKLSVEFIGKLPIAKDINGNFVNNVPLWPAFWMMGTGIWDGTSSWPNCGEIDVMEWASTKLIGNDIVNTSKEYSTAFHFANSNNERSYISKNFCSDSIDQIYHSFKTIIYRDTNDNGKIEMFFDGEKIHDYFLDINKTGVHTELIYEYNSQGQEINNTYKYYGLLINIALSGVYTGNAVIPNNFNMAEMFIKNVNVEKSSYTDVIEYSQYADFTGTFGGAYINCGNFIFPSGAESWAGFANLNTDLYPFDFSNGGQITFDAKLITSNVNIKFRFEKNPYPDVDPSFETEAIEINENETYTVTIPNRPSNERYSSFILYLIDRDIEINITNVKVEIN